jgi:hypothetical protein
MHKLFSLAKICILLAGLMGSACTEKIAHEVAPDGEGVAIYLADLQRTGVECAINLPAIQLTGEPLVTYPEIRSYNSRTHTFTLAGSALQRFQERGVTFGKSALVLTVDKQVVYAGWMWASLYSSTCDEVVFFMNDPIHTTAPDQLQVNFGYPYEGFAAGRPDLRNSNLLIERLRKDKKLRTN